MADTVVAVAAAASVAAAVVAIVNSFGFFLPFSLPFLSQNGALHF